MVTIRLKGVNTVRKRLADGTVRLHHYHRATKTRLPAHPGPAATRLELEAWEAKITARVTELNAQMVDSGPGKPAPGTMAALVEHYKGSREFLGLKEKTQKDYRRYLDIIARTWGRNRVATITREAVLNLRDAWQETPRTANYVMSVLRLLLGFAVDRPSLYGLTHNPAARPRNLKTGKGHRPWEEGEIALFRRHWPPGSLERTIFELALNTGQRGEDIAAMERLSIAANGTISVAQEKTSARVWIPVSADLRRTLEAWDEAQAERTRALEAEGKPVPLAMARMLLTTRNGRTLRIDHFRHIIADAFKAVPGLKTGMETGGVTTHGLRYTAATILSELGHDWETIAAITGHETAQMVKKYTAQKRRAKVAIASLDAARKERSPGDKNG